MATKTKHAPGVLIVVGLIFLTVAGFFMDMGVQEARRQSRMLATYLPVAARITSTSISSHRGSKGGTQYAPLIRFTYEVSGHQESSATAWITTTWGSHAWAQELVDRFPPGTATTAWHAPTGMNQAFLVHEASFGVYALILVPMFHCSLGAMMLLSGLGFGQGPAARWVLLLVASGLWDLVGVGVFSHYLLVGGRWSTAPIVALVIYGSLAAVLTSCALRATWPRRPQPSTIPGDEPNPYRGTS